MNHCLRNFKLVAASLVFLMLGGCATLFNNEAQQVALHSATEQSVGVRIKAPSAGEYRTTLPTVVSAKPSSFNDFSITVDDPCFEPTSYVVDKQIRSIYFLNFLNLHGLYIDYLSGHMWQYEPHVLVPVKPRHSDTGDCAARNVVASPTSAATAILVPPPRRPRHGIGAGLIPMRIHTTEETGGYYIYYHFQPAERYRFQARMLFNSQYNNENAYSLDYHQSLLSVALHVTPYANDGLYFGAGFGASGLRVSYIEYDTNNHTYDNSSIVDLQGTSYPVFFELGWSTRGRFNANLFANVSTQTLGLSPPTSHVDKKELDRISNIGARDKASRLYKTGGEFSVVGIGFGWNF